MSLTSTLSFVGSSLKDLIAPARCLNCLREDTWLCRNCRQMLPPPVTACIGCGEESSRGLTCTSCRSTIALTGAISAGSYNNGALRRGISWLKFKGVRAVAPELASLLIPQLTLIAPLQNLAQHAALVPIPLHTRRLRQRGFNQSEDIAHAISRYTGIPTFNILTRTKSTWTQSRLPHELRSKNLDDAFTPAPSVIARLDPRVKPEDAIQILILIDDVTTTGATLNAAAQAIRQQLPHIRIWAATVARG